MDCLLCQETGNAVCGIIFQRSFCADNGEYAMCLLLKSAGPSQNLIPCLFLLLLAAAVPTASFAQQEETILKGRVVYQLVDQTLRVTSFDSTSPRVVRWQSFNQAVTRDAPADRRVVIFDNVGLIDRLQAEDLQHLLAEFEAGAAVIGANGNGADLKASLGLLPEQLIAAQPVLPALDTWVVLMRLEGGQISELQTPAAPWTNVYGNEALNQAFELVSDWYSRNQPGPLDDVTEGSEDPWDALHIYEYSAYSKGYYDGKEQTAGTHKFTLSLFSLASNQQNSDWYRMDYQIISEITDYQLEGNHFGNTHGSCGWWSDELKANFKVETPGGEWFEYMPDTTVGSTTKGFSIGGSLTTSQAGISGEYSQSYGEPDVVITVEANSVSNSIDWKAKLDGCSNYQWYPDIHGASSPAKSTYNLNPSVIIQVPQGDLLKVQTWHGGNSTEIILEKDSVKICNLFAICKTPYKADIPLQLAVECTNKGGGCVVTFTNQ